MRTSFSSANATRSPFGMRRRAAAFHGGHAYGPINNVPVTPSAHSETCFFPPPDPQTLPPLPDTSADRKAPRPPPRKDRPQPAHPQQAPRANDASPSAPALRPLPRVGAPSNARLSRSAPCSPPRHKSNP